MPPGWILLVDTLAGSLILLSLSGVALWLLTRRRREPGDRPPVTDLNESRGK
jgi:hypothetical protein